MTPNTYYIDDLHERDSKADLYRLGFIGNRSLQYVVLVEKMVKQLLFVGPLHRTYQLETKTK